MASVRTEILDLVVARIILVFNHLLPGPALGPGPFLRAPPFVTGLVPVVEWAFLRDYFTGVRVDEVAIGGLRRRRLDGVLRAHPQLHPGGSGIDGFYRGRHPRFRYAPPHRAGGVPAARPHT